MQTDRVRAENKITDTALLTLNVGILKSEIGIVAYGPRAEIEQAINELRPEGQCEWLVASNAADFLIHPIIHNISHRVASSLPLPSCVFRERCLPGTLIATAISSVLLQQQDKSVTLVISFPMKERESSVALIRHLVSVSASSSVLMICAF